MTRIFVYESLSGSTQETPGDPGLREAGVAMRDAIVGDLLRLDGVAVTCAVNGAPGCATRSHPHGAALSKETPGAGEQALAFVARMADAHDWCWIVAPETDGLLGRLYASVGADRWIGCDGDAIRRASSKRDTLAALARHGLQTPLTSAASHRGRWLVKPDDGAGCLATRVHADRSAALADLGRRRRAGTSATLEPFIEGEALSISMLVGADLARVIALNRQRIAIGADGELRDLGVQPAAIDAATDARAADLEALAVATARALPGLRGFVGVDVVWNQERGAVPIEVNPRVTCAYVGLSGTLDRNLAADVLRLHGVGIAA
jgi:predicted ATP-grasp superfamily ATP-dependent carboligase